MDATRLGELREDGGSLARGPGFFVLSAENYRLRRSEVRVGSRSLK